MDEETEDPLPMLAACLHFISNLGIVCIHSTMKYIETVDCIVETSWDTVSNQPITSLPRLDVSPLSAYFFSLPIAKHVN
jgi:hypothetical protein